jgi:hypothetical protein
LIKFDAFEFLAFDGLDWPFWPFWPLLAFDDFYKLSEVFLSTNEGQTTTFHQSDIENKNHTNFSKAVQSEST